MSERAARDHRYSTSEKSRQRHLRYNASEKGQARQKRYQQSEKGREAHAHSNARRVFAGRMYLGLGGFTQRELEEMKRDGKIV